MEAVGADKVRYVLPGEGFTVWVDSLCIPKGAPSPYGAHLFIDYVCRPEVATELVDYIGYLSPNVAAAKGVESALVRRTTPSERELEDGEMINDVGDFARNYTDAWARVKSA
jgi:spermidine/putrescine transport system substrate-binding protein